jgi:integrase/recombinase XerD
MDEIILPIIEDFLEYFSGVRNFRPRSATSYKYSLLRAFRHIEKHPKDATPEDFTQLFLWMKGQYAQNTRRHVLAVLRMFYDFYCEVEKIPNPVAHIRNIPEEKTFPQVLTPQDIARAISYWSFKAPDYLCRRNAAILALMAGTGMRVGEIEALNVGDIQLRERNMIVHVRPQKSHHGRAIPFASFKEANLITEVFANYYLDMKYMQHMPDSAPLFLSAGIFRTGTRFLRGGISRMVYRTVKYAKLPEWTNCHSFRHFFAAYFMHNGGDLEQLRQLLGHALLSTTQRYIHVAMTIDDKVIDKYGTSSIKAPAALTGYARILKEIAKKQQDKK